MEMWLIVYPDNKSSFQRVSPVFQFVCVSVCVQVNCIRKQLHIEVEANANQMGCNIAQNGRVNL